jgi:hypothetical protein
MGRQPFWKDKACDEYKNKIRAKQAGFSKNFFGKAPLE